MAILPTRSRNSKKWFGFKPRTKLLGVCIKNPEIKDDPCEDGGKYECSEYAKCVVKGNDFECQCIDGFQGDGSSCEGLKVNRDPSGGFWYRV